MNVNPFSYLMNKISQKVSKSGDTMTGNLIISRNATTSELELGNNTTSKGLIILFSNNDKYEVLRSPDGMTANRNIYLPDASGTVALTSDVFKGQATAVLVKKITTTATTYAFDDSLANYKMVSICVNWDLGGDSNHALYAVGEPFPQSGAATYIYLNNDVNGPYAVVESMSNTSITIRGTSPSIGIRVYGIK